MFLVKERSDILMERNHPTRAFQYNEDNPMQKIYDALYQDSLNTRNFNSLMDLITRKENILLAYQNVRKNFGNLIERCDEALKNIQIFENMVNLYNSKINKYEDYNSFKVDLENDMRNMDKNLGSTYFDLIENETAENSRKLKELIDSYNSINEQLTTLIEKKSVFDKSSELVLSQLNTYKIPKRTNLVNGLDNPTPIEQVLKMEDQKKTDTLLDDFEVSELNFISGIIKAEDDMRMKRMIFRASRGRAIPTFFDLTIEDKLNQTKVEKKIFNIFLQGGTQNVLAQKIIQICDIFSASRFTIPKREDLASEINNVQQEIYDKKNYLKTVETSIKDFFKDKIGENNQPGRYDMYKLYFLQEKLLFSNLNKCKLRGNFIDGEVWIPEEKYQLVQESLLKITSKDPTNY